jgi:alkylhydroperoxidase/carboxymuconolactone decarboxylase family protein YurZ
VAGIMSDATGEHDAALQRGREMRNRVLGDHYSATGSSEPSPRDDFEQLALRFAWDSIWARPGLALRDRSAVTIMALIVLNRPVELALHVTAGLRNGLTAQEITEICLQSGVYCGMPAANAAFRIIEPLLTQGEQPA